MSCVSFTSCLGGFDGKVGHTSSALFTPDVVIRLNLHRIVKDGCSEGLADRVYRGLLQFLSRIDEGSLVTVLPYLTC